VQHERYVVLLRLLCSSSFLRKQLGRFAVDDALCSVVDVEHDLEFGRSSLWVEREGCDLDFERLSGGESLIESLEVRGRRRKQGGEQMSSPSEKAQDEGESSPSARWIQRQSIPLEER
jgi:hypothetical protein